MAPCCGALPFLRSAVGNWTWGKGPSGMVGPWGDARIIREAL